MSRKTLKDFPTFRLSRLSGGETDRKSTRLNSSHMSRSYAVFCLKKKNNGSPPGLSGAGPPGTSTYACIRWRADVLPTDPGIDVPVVRAMAHGLFSFSDRTATQIYTLSLHDALPI